jgi:hypothetical protein
MKRYDKSLTEVWDWKEQVYKDIKGLTTQDYLEKLKQDAERILSENHVKLTPISIKKELQKVA